MYNISYNSYRTVATYGKRVRFLIFHYTAQSFADSIKSLTGEAKERQVSAHYLVPDPTDKTYTAAGFKDLQIFNLVDEVDRAWHAGVSEWDNRTNINDTSIGIEIVNLAQDNNGSFNFPDFNPDQIKALIQLVENIAPRFIELNPTYFLAHSDIAYERKSDPGPRFPWHELYLRGFGAWYDAETVNKYKDKFKDKLPDKSELLISFKKYGYKTPTSDEAYKQLIRAFQMHFRPQKYDGTIDLETCAILYALVEKYKPHATS